ncbi:unnamed protein product [Thelazia callipaeda]|uniref:Phosphoinositide phospholipase C n=1 Tax=Thelazia callipaeda TaxID=103827 RepID=A0A0N5D2M5_THECL|nr:unnamed protein product [Thelazia callipaeda]
MRHSVIIILPRTTLFLASPSNLAAQGFVVEHQPIALFRSELEKLEHILLFPEEVAFQLSATEYKLFYEIQPMDYIRYVSSNLTSRSVAENPSPVRNLVKRLSEISSWITHLIISLPTDEDRKTRVTTILRIIDTCWSIGNFNAAVEILIGLKSEKLRPFWLSLKPEEKKKYEELCEILLPSDQTAVSPTYREAIQRALKMPQCKLIPFFGVFLRDLYAIVNDLPSIVMSADEGLTKEHNGNDYCASKIEVTGLLNADKINLVVVVLDNLELFHRHYKNRRSFILDQAESSTRKKKRKAKEYESVQAVEGSSKNVTLIPLDTNHFNLDVIQRLHHGTTVIRFDPETGRSTLCLLKLHASCGLLSWHKVGSFKTKDIRDKVCVCFLQSLTTTESCNPTLSPCTRPSGAVYATMDNGFLRLYDVKSVESVGSHEIDIESIYRRHSNEEMSVSIECWAINYGCHLSDNEFFYFIAPKKSAQCWLNGLIDIVNYMMEERKYADRRIIWLKKLYLQLYRIFDPCAKYCPQLSEALQAFGGQSKELKNLGAKNPVTSELFQEDYSEKPLTLLEFIELYKLFNIQMRKDLNREIYERQQNIHNALTLATTNSTGSMDTSKTLFLTPRMLQKFIEIHQMEIVDEDYAAKLIEEHEPDISNRINKLLSFEGFVRYLTDSNNYAFVPEAIKPDASTLHYPLSYYYICSSHNTYLTGHQLKGESSTEMYRQVLLTGCRCIELDCWDGENGRPQIFHGHTLTSKIDFSQVLNAIRKNAFVTSSLPVILSIENHCSLQQQARMAQMFQNYLDEKLVRHFLFAADYSDSPRLPSPWQLQNKILIKDKKMIAEPNMTFEQTDGSYGVDEDDLEESDNYEDPNDDNEEGQLHTTSNFETHPKTFYSRSSRAKRLEACDKRTSYEVLSAPSETVSPRSMKKGPGIALAPELSDLVNYLQAVKFKNDGVCSSTTRINEVNNDRNSSHELKFVINAKFPATIIRFFTVLRREQAKIVSLRNCATDICILMKHPLKFIAYSRDQIVRTYPGGIRIDSSNFNPIQYWSFGIQMVALNFQTADTAMAVNTAMFEQNGNCGYVLKPRVFWDISHPLYNRFNPRSKDISLQSALLYKITIISGQHVCPNQHAASSYVELEIIGLPADCAKEKSKTVSRNSVNPIWNYTTTFRIVFVELAFLRISICDSTNGRCIAQRVVPVRFIRAGYRHLPLRTPANVPIEQGTVFLYSRFEQEEYIHVHECDDDTYEFNVHHLKVFLQAANLKTVPILRRQIFVLQVSGLYNDDTMVTVHVGLSSTVKNVIQMALINAGKNADTVEDYILAELTIKRFSADSDEQCAHRILQPNELIMDSVACWNGSIRRFVIKKKETDSGSRTWINSLIKSGMTMPSSSLASLSPSSSMSPSEKRSNSGVRGQQSPFQVKKTFLVCVHNVSKNQPYIILRANINSMASDIIKQVFLQTRQTDINETEFVLVEETLKDFSLRTAKSQHENLTLRVLGPEENVYKAQSMWKTSGRFILENRNDTIRSAQEQVRNLLQALENACISSSSKLLNTH